MTWISNKALGVTTTMLHSKLHALYTIIAYSQKRTAAKWNNSALVPILFNIKHKVHSVIYRTVPPMLKTVKSTLYLTPGWPVHSNITLTSLWNIKPSYNYCTKTVCAVYPPLPIGRYSYIPWSKLEQCSMSKMVEPSCNIVPNVLLLSLETSNWIFTIK